LFSGRASQPHHQQYLLLNTKITAQKQGMQDKF